jgi:hypothetical protein
MGHQWPPAALPFAERAPRSSTGNAWWICSNAQLAEPALHDFKDGGKVRFALFLRRGTRGLPSANSHRSNHSNHSRGNSIGQASRCRDVPRRHVRVEWVPNHALLRPHHEPC